MLKWVSWDYFLAWCTIMGVMNHFPSAWVKTINVHQNVDRSPVCTFHIFSPWNNLQVQMTLFHFPLVSNPISSQFYIWADLALISLRSEEMIILELKLDCFHLYPISILFLYSIFWLLPVLTCLWVSYQHYFILCYLYRDTCKWIFLNIIQTSLRSLWFDLLWLRPENFIIPVLVFHFCPSASYYFLFTCLITLS